MSSQRQDTNHAGPDGAAYTVVVFDIDGTLLTTGGAGAKAWQLAFEKLYGISADISDYTEDGWPDYEVCRRTFIGVLHREPSEIEINTLVTNYLTFIDDTLRESTTYRVMPGVPELLERLGDAGFLLGITTGNVAGAAHLKLERGHLNKYFAFGGYGSDSADRSMLTRKAIERAGRLLAREVSPREVLVVGDTPRDIAAAQAVGADSVGVATGHFSEAELAACEATYVLATVEHGFPL